MIPDANLTDGTIDITFIDNPAWRNAITGWEFNGQQMPAHTLTIQTGKITFPPDAPSGTLTIKIIATGYPDAVVVQIVPAV